MDSFSAVNYVRSNIHIQWHSIHRVLLQECVDFSVIEHCFIVWFKETSFKPKKRGLMQYFELRHYSLLTILNTFNN